MSMVGEALMTVVSINDANMFNVLSYRTSDQLSNQQNLQQGLEEMKQQYMTTVEKIRGW